LKSSALAKNDEKTDFQTLFQDKTHLFEKTKYGVLEHLTRSFKQKYI